MDLVLTEFTLIYSAAVVKLKTLTSLLAADEQLSNETVENMRTMQKVLVYIVTIISNFMDLEPTTTRISQFLNSSRHTLSSSYLATVVPSTSKDMVSDKNWQKKAIVSVMEAGGVNWLVGKVIFSMFVYDDSIIVTVVIVK
jgi:predicted transcriptional regulator YheO